METEQTLAASPRAATPAPDEVMDIMEDAASSLQPSSAAAATEGDARKGQEEIPEGRMDPGPSRAPEIEPGELPGGSWALEAPIRGGGVVFHSSILQIARQALDKLEGDLLAEEHRMAEERARLAQAWYWLDETV
ncbi:hypothetical protein JBE27_49825 [Streptomyces albiflaviniger]|nr:hypothetical protein [Streptomyces albiflaviniger]